MSLVIFGKLAETVDSKVMVLYHVDLKVRLYTEWKQQTKEFSQRTAFFFNWPMFLIGKH